MTPTVTVAYVALFVTAALVFLSVSLMLGRIVRPHAPSGQKLEPYECGEPPVGSAYIQFDLRFYVVALVFIIFEVEVALFFPPATVFGKAVALMNPALPISAAAQTYEEMVGGDAAAEKIPPGPGDVAAATSAQPLALAAMIDLGLFFAVLLVAFAYVWYRGDLDWVRAVGEP